MTDLDSLRKAAEKATPGPWLHGYEDGSGKNDPGEGACITGPFGLFPVIQGGDMDGVAAGVLKQADATFIALANPATVLALLDRLDRAEAVVEAARESVSDNGYSLPSRHLREALATYDQETP